ncbi:MBL fold metallo-hydrolase [Bacillus lacus]|uniref:MBL fold metallo-hydrolase n=1 Tax=Metabacillus lacus TaxID=1983721 RepID=A0A7X2J2Q0_9BACI|nr:MBL fold metallo-hydrolase [Metabacillus lacus]MRX74280.1 MBL fold metallo-hydrolase [Metabacillus lacus]
MKLSTGAEFIHTITMPTPFPVGDVNAYLIKGDVLTLVDAGPKTEEALLSMKSQLQQAGCRLQDIEQVVLTHHHPDHVGLLDYLPHDVSVIGHPYNAAWLMRDQTFLENQHAYFSRLFVEFGVDPVFLPLLSQLHSTLEYSCHRALTSGVMEGDSLPGLKDWKILDTPGHAQSHIVLYRENDGLLIAGDLLLSKISPNPLLEPPQTGSSRPRPLLQYISSIQKLLHIPISSVLTGHGEPIPDAHTHILLSLKKQEERAKEVLELLRQKPLTAFEVCRLLFPKIYKRQFLLTMSETVGQLDFLEEHGKIKAEYSGETVMYEAVRR